MGGPGRSSIALGSPAAVSTIPAVRSAYGLYLTDLTAREVTLQAVDAELLRS
jgi:hypothetical protein